MNTDQIERLQKLKSNIEAKIIFENESSENLNPKKNDNLRKLNISLKEVESRIEETEFTNSNNDIDNMSAKKFFKKGNKKKNRKMWASVVILLAIIAVVVALSWILKWSGVQVNAASTIPFADWINSDNEGIQKVWQHWLSTGNGAAPGTEDFSNWLNANSNYLKELGMTISSSGLASFTEKTGIIGLGLADIFYLPLKGFEKQVQIIIFILTIGAFINIVVKSKALEGMAQNITLALKGKEVYAIIPLMLFFSITGSIEGMSEETLGFYAIMVPLMLMAGFDTFTALMVVFMGAGLGVVGSTLNPFAITVAVDKLNGWAGSDSFISTGDGLLWRFATWATITITGIGFTMRYAKRVKRNPQLSYVFATMEGDRKFFLSQSVEKIDMNWRRKITAATFGLAFLLMLAYLINWDSIFGITWFETASQWFQNNVWFITKYIPGIGVGYLIEVATFFFIFSVFLGVLNGLGQEGFLRDFTEGAADYIGVVFVLSVAAGVSIGIEWSNMKFLITDVLTNSVGSIENNYLKIVLLFIFFLPISFLIPSTSGFSTLIFPLIAPLLGHQVDGVWVADEVLASGSIAAFVVANGLINLFSPMTPSLMGGLILTRMDYGTYLKRIWPFLLTIFAIAIAMLCLGVFMSENVNGNIA